MKKLIVLGAIVAAMGCGGGKGASNGGAGGTTGAGGGATGSAGTTGSGGRGQCPTGSEGCACYGNDSCDSGLECLSHLCVATTGTGGSATGTGGSGTGGSTAGTAGATGSGGSTAGTAGTTGTGGSGTGGSAAGTAGATGTGGSSQCTTGSEGCACYANDTCNGTLKCLSHLCVSLTGTAGTTGTGGSATGTAGTTGTGGSATGTAGTTSTGGSATGTAGTTGTGGSGTAGTSGGNTLTFDAGVIMAGSNNFGIVGAIYTFSDGAGSTITPNCTSDTCFASVTGPGPFCVSGTGTTVLLNSSTLQYDYATYWGAALGMDLYNPTNTSNAQEAYVASAHGVTGFQFSFQNKATSSVRLTYKVRDPSTSMVLDYCLNLTTSTSAIHFSDAKLQCYNATPGPALTAALADHIEQIQWQVPTSTVGTTPFNFCINSITPLTN